MAVRSSRSDTCPWSVSLRGRAPLPYRSRAHTEHGHHVGGMYEHRAHSRVPQPPSRIAAPDAL